MCGHLTMAIRKYDGDLRPFFRSRSLLLEVSQLVLWDVLVDPNAEKSTRFVRHQASCQGGLVEFHHVFVFKPAFSL